MCDIHVDGICLEHVSEYKYLGCVLDVSGTDRAECSRKMASRRRGSGAIRSLINARDLQLEFDRVLHETLLVPVFTYGRDTMLWIEKERSIGMAVQIDNLRGLLGIRRMNRVPNARIRELCGVRKGLYERIGEGVLRWLGHVERMERDNIARESV